MFYTSHDCNQNNQPSVEPSGDAIEAHRRKFPKVIINVGGVRHEVMWRLFLKRPLTRLGMLAKVGQDMKDLLDDGLVAQELALSVRPSVRLCLCLTFMNSSLNLNTVSR